MEAHYTKMNTSNDPFYVVKDKVQILKQQLVEEMEQWQNLVTSRTVTEELKQSHNTLKGIFRDIKTNLKDLADTIEIVAKHRSRFPDINDVELARRKNFVDEARAEVSDAEQRLKNEWRKRQEQMNVSAAPEERTRQGDQYVRDQSQQQDQLEKKQDVLLDDMSSVLERLGALGGTINIELKEQEVILDEMDREMDDTDARMNIVMKKIQKLLATSGHGKLICIVVLFLILVVLFFAVVYT